nr:hypothetical protein [uncultured Brevundimonas sp.]
MNKHERDALAHELEKLVGNVNPDGSPYVDPETVCDPVELEGRRAPRPSREKIRAIAERLAARRAARLAAAPKAG